MSGQVSRSSAGEYQADERAGVARLLGKIEGRRKRGRLRMRELEKQGETRDRTSRGWGSRQFP